MARTRITSRTLDALKARAESESRPLLVWDETTRGFGCRVAPSGQVSWFVQKWQGGRGGGNQRYTFKAKNLTKARTEAEKLIGQVHSGVDLPNRRRERRAAKREALNATKLQETAELFIKRNRKPGRYWDELEARFNNEIIPALGKDTRVADITKAELRNLIEAKVDKGHPGGARLLFAALRPFFKWCAERELVATSPLDGITPPKPPKARDRVLADHEVKAVWDATATLPLFGPFYRLLLLTAQRREEVGAMRWEELDLEAGTWTIPKERTKNGKEHLVHLSPQALTVINGLQRIDGCSFLFSTTCDTPISGYGKAKARLDALMGDVPGWRVHDIRRTAASGMAKLGFQPHVIERVLNHISGAQGGLVGVYQRHEYLDERRKALDAWGSYVSRLVSISPQKTNVLQLHSTRNLN